MGNLKKKEKQLKMSFGKANQILRKNILFHLLIVAKENICYQCKKEITHISHLSIEHKKNWLDSKNPVELFFDLNNIAFSHLKCNASAGGKISSKKFPRDMKYVRSFRIKK